MSANVYGGPSSWRANLDDLTRGTAELQAATQETMRLAGDALLAGGLLSGITLLTPQGPLLGAHTVQLSAGLLGLRADVAALSHGVQASVAAYLAAEAHISTAFDALATPGAVMLSLLGATTSLNVPNDAYEIAIRGTTTALWLPVEGAFNALNTTVPGAKYVAGHAIGWMLGLEQSVWEVPPTRRTFGMLAQTMEHLGLIQLAPYAVTNVTPEPGGDGWQVRAPIEQTDSLHSMALLHDYAYEPNTVTIARITQPDGAEAYAVLYSGTTPLGEDAGFFAHQDAFGVVGVVESVAADSVYVAEATHTMLEQAGVPAGATVIPMGYSQGGTHAVNVALSPAMSATYDIADVLTVAAPTGHRTTEDFDTNFVHIEHEHDKVTALVGAQNEARLNRTTIEVHGYPAHDVEAGVFGPEHNFGLISQQLGTALEDPKIAAATAIPLRSVEAKMSGTVAVQQFQLDRQQAVPARHPQTAPTGTPGGKHRVIGLRPFPQWRPPGIR